MLPELKVTLERRESKELEATKDLKKTKEIPETLSKMTNSLRLEPMWVYAKTTI